MTCFYTSLFLNHNVVFILYLYFKKGSANTTREKRMATGGLGFLGVSVGTLSNFYCYLNSVKFAVDDHHVCADHPCI